MAEENIQWKIQAMDTQLQFFETLGTRPYDEIEKSNLFLFKKKVGFATCGKPSVLPSCTNYNTGYKEDQLTHIKSLCQKIIEKSDFDPVRFACIILVLYHKGEVCETPVFKIVQTSGNIFIDTYGRIYNNWEHFMKKNRLPDCEYCFPVNGEYNAENQVGFAYSPASGIVEKTTACLDSVGCIASVAAAAVFATSLCITVAPVAVTVAGATAACTGVYSVSRNVTSLYDRKKHEQPVGLSDKESRSAWISLASSAVGVATFAAVSKAQKVYEGGKSLAKFSLFGLRALNASSLVFSGFGFVENLIICSNKFKNGTLTRKDVFDLSCELLFFFNAIASVKATNKLVNNMSAAVSEAPLGQRKLTKTQKRNLRKRAAKKRALGSTPESQETNSSSKTVISTPVNVILLEAIRLYNPKLQELVYKFQSVGHDLMSWKMNEISDVQLFTKLSITLQQIYNNYRKDVSEVLWKIVTYFTPLTDKVKENIYRLFEEATEEIRSIFCSKVMNLEGQLEIMINDADMDIMLLHESLEIQDPDCSTETSAQENDNSGDDSNLSMESQTVLSYFTNFLATSMESCNDLQKLNDILEGFKYVVLNEFKKKVSNYKSHLEAAKSASEGPFDLNKFHSKLNITGEVGQHLFNETVQSLDAKDIIYKIKSACKNIENKGGATTTRVREELPEQIFHCFGPHGKGNVPRLDLLSLVSRVIDIPFTENTCKLTEAKDIILIEINDNPNIEVVVYCTITEKNTASIMILVIT